MNVFAKFALFCCLIGATAVALPKNFQHKHKEAFAEFKSSYNKQYASAVEELMRFQIFANTLDKINKFNQQEPKAGYTLGLNHFSDMLSSELTSLNGLRMPKHSLKNNADASKYYESVLARNVSVPDEIDWRKVSGRVSDVKNQGNECGSCWAFSTIGMLEGQEKTHKTKKDNDDDEAASLVELSEQELVDCSKQNHGCWGGAMIVALEDIAKLGGVEREEDYPYLGAERKCKFNKSKTVFNDKGGYIMEGKDEVAMKEVVAKYGPLSAAIYADNFGFLHYKGGVYYNATCPNQEDDLNHGVLIVGYGTEKVGGDYWLVKNSWGSKWGDRGYIKMARNRNNHCGIAHQPTLATF